MAVTNGTRSTIALPVASKWRWYGGASPPFNWRWRAPGCMIPLPDRPVPDFFCPRNPERTDARQALSGADGAFFDDAACALGARHRRQAPFHRHCSRNGQTDATRGAGAHSSRAGYTGGFLGMFETDRPSARPGRYQQAHLSARLDRLRRDRVADHARNPDSLTVGLVWWALRILGVCWRHLGLCRRQTEKVIQTPDRGFVQIPSPHRSGWRCRTRWQRDWTPTRVLAIT